MAAHLQQENPFYFKKNLFSISIFKKKTRIRIQPGLFHLLCIHALCTDSRVDYLFEAVRYCCMHNKCMKLHTEITFSKLAYPRCDPHVIG